MSKDTREKIICATLGLLYINSYGAVSVDDICRRADVRKGSFYHYFPSKIDAVLEAFEQMWIEVKPRMDEAFSCQFTPKERLAAYAKALYYYQHDLFAKHGKVLGCPCVSASNELSTQEDRIRERSSDIFLRYARYFETMLNDAKAQGGIPNVENTELAARDLFSYILGMIYQAKICNNIEMLRTEVLPGLGRYLGWDLTTMLPEKLPLPPTSTPAAA